DQQIGCLGDVTGEMRLQRKHSLSGTQVPYGLSHAADHADVRVTHGPRIIGRAGNLGRFAEIIAEVGAGRESSHFSLDIDLAIVEAIDVEWPLFDAKVPRAVKNGLPHWLRSHLAIW